MSGGVDSSVAAALLVEQGYEVIGLMLRLWAEQGGAANRCCTPDAIADARRVADALDIPFYVRDYKEVFREQIELVGKLAENKEFKITNMGAII